MGNFKRNKLEVNENDSLFKVLSSMQKNAVHIALIKGKVVNHRKSSEDLMDDFGNYTNSGSN